MHSMYSNFLIRVLYTLKVLRAHYTTDNYENLIMLHLEHACGDIMFEGCPIVVGVSERHERPLPAGKTNVS